MKVLNLDSLSVATNRRLMVSGQIHEISPLKVADFIRITEQAKKVDERAKAGEITAIDELNLTIDMIMSTVPTLERVELENLALEEIHKISAFIKGADLAEAVEELAEADAEGK